MSKAKGEALAGWFDGRVGLFSMAKANLRKVFPDHWSFLLGEIALFCFVILWHRDLPDFFFVPSGQLVIPGPVRTAGRDEVSAAFDSVMKLSFEVQAGLLMRQVHHWTAVIFVAVIVAPSRGCSSPARSGAARAELDPGFGLLLFAWPREHGVLVARRSPVRDRVADLLLGGAFGAVHRAVAGVAAVRLASSRHRRSSRGFFVLHVMLLPAVHAGGITVPRSCSCSSRSTRSSGARSRGETTWSDATSGRARRSCRPGCCSSRPR